MEILPEGSAINEAIAKNDSASLIGAVKEYARLTRNPHNSEMLIPLGPSIPFSPTQSVHAGLHDKTEDAPQDGLQKERLWLSGLFYNTGNDCYRKGHYELALACYQEADRHRPDPSTINNLAAIYKRMGNYGSALECHQRNITDFPSYVPAYGRIAIFLSAYGCSTDTPPLEYLRTYFAKGGNKLQLQAFVTGTPRDEADALERLLIQMKLEDTSTRAVIQKSKSKPSKQFRDRFGRR